MPERPRRTDGPQRPLHSAPPTRPRRVWPDAEALTIRGARDRELPALLDRPPDGVPARGGIVLAHGAGGTSRMAFLARAARRLAAAGWLVLRFDFGYAVGRGRPGPPERPTAPERRDLAAALETMHGLLPDRLPIYLAGKSYGGRVATFVAAEVGPEIAGVIVFGYPIEPPGRTRPADVAALRALEAPLLVIQGTRDTLGPLAVLERALAGRPEATVSALAGADHSYRLPAGTHSRPTLLEDRAIDAAIGWLEAQDTPDPA